MEESDLLEASQAKQIPVYSRRQWRKVRSYRARGRRRFRGDLPAPRPLATAETTAPEKYETVPRRPFFVEPAPLFRRLLLWSTWTHENARDTTASKAGLLKYGERAFSKAESSLRITGNYVTFRKRKP